MGKSDKQKAEKQKSSASVERSVSMKPQVSADALYVINGLGCCVQGMFYGTCKDGCLCPVCKGEWTLWCFKCQCCCDTGTEYLKMGICEPQCQGCAWFFKCSSQCCCCVSGCALPTNAENPCTIALAGYTCYPGTRRGCCKKLAPGDIIKSDGVQLQKMDRDSSKGGVA